jgi:hypothetical protein
LKAVASGGNLVKRKKCFCEQCDQIQVYHSNSGSFAEVMQVDPERLPRLAF